MFPTLPVGPLALPTEPVLAILAVILTLDVAGRYGSRLGINADDVWNVGLIALTAALIVARLWNVFQFWYIYQNEPYLIFSLRPSGFTFWPGLIAAIIGGYGYLLHRALDPVRVAAALAVGAVVGSIVIGISGFATGTLMGLTTDLPWLPSYFGETRHPVGLYRAIGSATLHALLWLGADRKRPGRVVLLALLGYSLIRLITDSFLAEVPLLAGIRISQWLALAVALGVTLLLAQERKTLARESTEGD